MAGEVDAPDDVWRVHDFLAEKRKETDDKYLGGKAARFAGGARYAL